MTFSLGPFFPKHTEKYCKAAEHNHESVEAKLCVCVCVCVWISSCVCFEGQ